MCAGYAGNMRMTRCAFESLKAKAMTIEEKYQMACRTPTDIYQHLPTLRRYAKECHTVTELGVRTIVSTWAFLAGLKEAGGGGAAATKLLSVDYIHPRVCGADLDEVMRMAAAEGIDFEFRQEDDRTIDLPITGLLFIDTWHVYEQLNAELFRHAVKAQQFIILHDTETFARVGETEGHAGLKLALNKFLNGANGPDGAHWKVREHFTHCNGLTVLERRA